ncbi:unnamed protein product, partial [Symbiodinium necroappetens]
EYVHQADVSFYMVCRSFDREKFEMHNWEAKLQRAYDEITNCQDSSVVLTSPTFPKLAMGESRVISLSFTCQAETFLGQEVRVVGSTEDFGHWNPALAPALKTDASAYPKWFGNVDCRACRSEYKFVLFDTRDGRTTWEPGINRCFSFSFDGHAQTRGRAELHTSRFGVADNTGPRIEESSWNMSESKVALTEHAIPADMRKMEHEEVQFDVICNETAVGETVVVVGCCKELGSWNPMDALRLSTSPEIFPRWKGTAHLARGAYELKLAIISQNSARWETSENGHIALPAGEDGPWQARSSWNSNLWEMHPRRSKDKESDDKDLAERYSGLCDQELMRRSDGVVLPEAPMPPAGTELVDEPKLRLWAGAHSISKAHGNCEDAYFVTAHSMGVADGVGCFAAAKYSMHGVNAAEYAAELMHIASLALQPEGRASENLDHKVAQRAAIALAEAESKAVGFGASTITVMCQQDTQIGIANLGDSGVMVLRRGLHGMKVIMKSDEQQHGFNCPYQLTRLPEALLSRISQKRLDAADTAADCKTYTVEIKEGDLLLMFSDGLSDNLHIEELLAIVDRASPAQADMLGLMDPESVAKALALAAQDRSLDPEAVVPFTAAARRHGFNCKGGKEDDITVAAAWVVKDMHTAETATEAPREESPSQRHTPELALTLFESKRRTRDGAGDAGPKGPLLFPLSPSKAVF